LPLIETLNGHLLHGWPDSSLMWYVPAFAPADDTDPTFAFAATQSAADSAGNPFNKLRLSFRLKKIVPADVTDLQKAQPAVKLQEVPLHYSTPTLTVSYVDTHSGAPQTATLNGAAALQPDGSLDLIFDNVLGVNVVILFENLRSSGTAVVTLAANYQAWPAGTGKQRAVIPRRPIFVRANIAETNAQMMRPVAGVRPAIMMRRVMEPPDPPDPVSTPEPPPRRRHRR
jgi:hypothetical protein